jgi:tight adherence protein B
MSNFVVIILTIWVAVMAIWLIVSKVFRSSDVDRIKNRVAGTPAEAKEKKGKGGSKSLINQEISTGTLTDLLKKYNLLDVTHNLLEQAGLKWHPQKLIHTSLFMFVIFFAMAWTMVPGNFRYLALLAGVLGAAVPVLYVLRLRKKRLHRFEELFPESLEFVARSMRAGHAFSVSLEMIHKEFQEPLAGEFRRTFEEHNLGLPLEVALQKLATRIPSLDVHFFVSAVLLQKRTGGNLAEILDKLAYIIRERFKLRGKIRAISAHGRMTGTALTLIPLAVAVLMFYVNPDYIKFFFTDETGNYMMGGAVLLQLIGYAVIKKIVSIEV